MQREADEEQREEITAVALVGQVAVAVQRRLREHGNCCGQREYTECALELGARPCERAGQPEERRGHDDPPRGVRKDKGVAPHRSETDEMERSRRVLVVPQST